MCYVYGSVRAIPTYRVYRLYDTKKLFDWLLRIFVDLTMVASSKFSRKMDETSEVCSFSPTCVQVFREQVPQVHPTPPINVEGTSILMRMGCSHYHYVWNKMADEQTSFST